MLPPRTENETISTLNQKSSINTVGVQLNVPLFSGGRVNALTDQAVANRGRAQAELEVVVNDVLVEVERRFLAVQTGVSRVAAYQKAVDASLVAVTGNKRGMAAGIRTNTDVLDAERHPIAVLTSADGLRAAEMGSTELDAALPGAMR